MKRFASKPLGPVPAVLLAFALAATACMGAIDAGPVEVEAAPAPKADAGRPRPAPTGEQEDPPPPPIPHYGGSSSSSSSGGSAPEPPDLRTTLCDGGAPTDPNCTQPLYPGSREDWKSVYENYWLPGGPECVPTTPRPRYTVGIPGSVIDCAGHGVPNVRVSAPAEGCQAVAYTDANGQFLLEAPGVGKWDLSFDMYPVLVEAPGGSVVMGMYSVPGYACGIVAP